MDLLSQPGYFSLAATVWFDQKVKLLTIAQFACGKVGKAITWSLFLFLFYCLFVAYMEGGGQLFHSFLAPLLSNTPVFSRGARIFLSAGLAGTIAYLGTQRPQIKIQNLVPFLAHHSPFCSSRRG